MCSHARIQSGSTENDTWIDCVLSGFSKFRLFGRRTHSLQNPQSALPLSCKMLGTRSNLAPGYDFSHISWHFLDFPLASHVTVYLDINTLSISLFHSHVHCLFSCLLFSFNLSFSIFAISFYQYYLSFLSLLRAFYIRFRYLKHYIYLSYIPTYLARPHSLATKGKNDRSNVPWYFVTIIHFTVITTIITTTIKCNYGEKSTQDMEIIFMGPSHIFCRLLPVHKKSKKTNKKIQISE